MEIDAADLEQSDHSDTSSGGVVNMIESTDQTGTQLSQSMNSNTEIVRIGGGTTGNVSMMSNAAGDESMASLEQSGRDEKAVANVLG